MTNIIPLARYLFRVPLLATLILAATERSAGEVEPGHDTLPGHADSQALMQRIELEIARGLARRGPDAVAKQHAYHAHIAELMDNSAGENTYADKTGNCRLQWVDDMMRRPATATAEANLFTRQLHAAARHARGGLHRVLHIAATRMDVPPLDHPASIPPSARATQDLLLTHVSDRLRRATLAWQAALAALTPEQVVLLEAQLYPVSTRDIASGAVFSDRTVGRQVTDQLERIDHVQLYAAAHALLDLNDPALLAALAVMPTSAPAKDRVDGAAGTVLRLFTIGDITILLGGFGDNTYALDDLTQVDAVIDPGGNDRYEEGRCSADRRVLVIIDLAGDDYYHGTQPGIQGGAVLGASLLIDVNGDDVYDAEDVSQGSALGGVGILIDHEGHDRYRGLRRTQGQAVGGLGILLDRSGNDRYHAALLAQGVGGPLGFGLLDDLEGRDHYYAGGKYNNPYDDTPGYDGWSQGVGAGPRGVANGGLGVLLDGAGDDLYECDYFSHGGGYWFAAGFARDFAGNDQRIGATRVAYDGGPRKDEQFLRWGLAYGCHFASGFLFDDSGDDIYGGNIVGIAFAWDFGITALCDFAGNDRYAIPSSGSALCAEAGLAILFDASGDDHYTSSSHGLARPGGNGRGNFSFAIDYGGADHYANSAFSDDGEFEHGCTTGFVIDRPKPPSMEAIGKVQSPGGTERP